MMKTSYWLGVLIVVVLMVHFSAGGLIGFQSKVPTKNLTIEKVISPQAIQNTLTPGEQFNQNKSIFSKTTIITLVVAVMGIVAFRRNHYS